ncbi:SCO family protein [Tritonibacter horizontis]|uniref:SCO1/SenC n=1 Tax=Tritonibacter horizontis TaxID=1768241 RepID=A0A132BSC4_9RHOB|nr:SCO family protein [Tritonibacter horizontis]KUP91299.1 SCO1/SenC [Tritonibacter horizontis]
MRRLLHLLALLCWPALAQAQVQGVMLDAPVALPDLAFHDETGATFTSADLKGQWTLVMIGFMSCPDVCPFTLGNLEAAVAETGMRVRPDNLPKVWFLSVDPDRDGAFVSEYAPFFHPDFRSMTGTRAQIDRFIDATDGFYRLLPADKDGYYEVQHSSAVSVIAPDGTLRAKLQPPFDPGLTAEFLARLQLSYRKEKTQ